MSTVTTAIQHGSCFKVNTAACCHLIVPRQLFEAFLSRVREIVKCNGTEEKLGKMPEEEDRTTWPSQKDGKPYENKQQEVKHSLTITVKPSQAYPSRLHY